MLSRKIVVNYNRWEIINHRIGFGLKTGVVAPDSFMILRDVCASLQTLTMAKNVFPLHNPVHILCIFC